MYLEMGWTYRALSGDADVGRPWGPGRGCCVFLRRGCNQGWGWEEEAATR